MRNSCQSPPQLHAQGKSRILGSVLSLARGLLHPQLAVYNPGASSCESPAAPHSPRHALIHPPLLLVLLLLPPLPLRCLAPPPPSWCAGRAAGPGCSCCCRQARPGPAGDPGRGRTPTPCSVRCKGGAQRHGRSGVDFLGGSVWYWIYGWVGCVWGGLSVGEGRAQLLSSQAGCISTFFTESCLGTAQHPPRPHARSHPARLRPSICQQGKAEGRRVQFTLTARCQPER